MLVLSRKTGQQIHIGPGIVVSILEIGGKFVRVGIEAPDSVCILRGEVKEQIEQENRAAADHTRHLDGLRRIGSFMKPLQFGGRGGNSDGDSAKGKNS